MFTILLLIGTWSSPTPQTVVQTWDRNTQYNLPLQQDGSGNGLFGEADRKADHATVATNSVGDVLVAFHSSRPTYDTQYPLLKQVEIALLTYDESVETWTLVDTNQKVVGSCEWSPLGSLYPQQHVKCERPDVIAVGEWFFVVWTRIYQREYGGTSGAQDFEPAVLECAWVRNNGGNIEVYATAFAGQGFPLDIDNPSGTRFHVRECSGCPDAVMLHAGGGGELPTVGVVYPHQTDFGDYPTGSGDNSRLFELRFLTCSIDESSSFLIDATQYPSIPATSSTGLVYNGDADAAGIVLPDVAPASVPWRFGLAYEDQIQSGSVTNGRIILETWEVNPTGPSLSQLESHTFGSSSSTTFRRRPMLSSYPAAFPEQDVFAIAFNRKTPPGTGDVVYQEWLFTEGANQLYWNAEWGWDNSDPSNNDVKPVPLLGREFASNQYFGRCYAERTASGIQCILKNYVRLAPSIEDTLLTIQTANHLQRPATSYWYDILNDADTVALTLEQDTTVGSLTPVQIWLRME